MEVSEIIKKVKRIELSSKRKANNIFMGEYQSAFKGRGMIFSEIRPYQYGDDVRNIDWKKTAFLNEPHVKVFEEEREMTMVLMVDVSASGQYGTKKQVKYDTIAEICATLAFSATAYNDKIGLILYSDQVELFVPPKKGKRHVLRIIRDLVKFQPQSKNTDLTVALEFLMNSFKRKVSVFIFSDFIDSSDYGKAVKIAVRKHDVTAIRVFDEKETAFPDIGLVHLEDNETGEIRLVNTSSPYIRKMYEDYYKDLSDRFELIFKQANSGYIALKTHEDYIKPLLNFFKRKKLS